MKFGSAGIVRGGWRSREWCGFILKFLANIINTEDHGNLTNDSSGLVFGDSCPSADEGDDDESVMNGSAINSVSDLIAHWARRNPHAICRQLSYTVPFNHSGSSSGSYSGAQ